ncbi:MAG: TetR/AcrR family transcriptional regulator [Myxococcota bacterium]|nr:TetR/AcrR family transcriptional regulator [Myxococcota bacterium]
MATHRTKSKKATPANFGARSRQDARQAARAQKEELYRKLVLEAAEPIFAEHGYDEARIGEISAASGLSLQTLYSAFPGKASIFEAIQERRDEALHARVLQAAQDIHRPLDALLTGFRAATLYFLENPDFLRIRLHGGFTWGTEESAAGDQGRTGAWRAALERLKMSCERCIAAGVFVQRDPALMARMMVAIQQVELAHWLEEGMLRPAQEVSDDLAAQVTRAFLRTPQATLPAGSKA